MDPITEFLDLATDLEKQAAEDLRDKQKKELEMWKRWVDGGKKQQDLRPLLSSLRPFIRSISNQWATVQRDVPPAAIHAEFVNHAVKALETYDPTRAGLNTYLASQMRKAPRFVKTYQNAAYIPETRSYSIQPFKDAVSNLTEELGRPPTQLELADRLKWSPRKVATLQKEIKSVSPASQFKYDPTSYVPSQQQEVLRLLPYELSGDERAVFEYIYGIGGKPRLSPGEIAKKLNMSAPKVSRLKSAIAAKYEKYVR